MQAIYHFHIFYYRFSSHRETFRSSFRDDDRDAFARPTPRDYTSSRTTDYAERPPREYRDAPRDYGSSRDYPSRSLNGSGRDYRER